MIFIDGSNLYHVLMRNCGRYDLYFSKFATKLANKRKIERIFYYNVRQELEGKITIPEQQKKFLSTLNRIPNIEVKLGIWKEQNGSIVEKGVDVLLATDLVLNAAKNKFDTAMTLAIQEAYYLQARNPSNYETLVELAVEIGADKKIFLKDVTSEDTDKILKEEIQKCKNLDLKSLPSLLFVNGEKKIKIEPNYLDAEVMLNKIELFK